MNYASLSQSTKLLKGAPANGVENPPSIGSHNLEGQTTTKVAFFAAHVVKHSSAPLPVLFDAK
jgi:hypothetical protein